MALMSHKGIFAESSRLLPLIDLAGSSLRMQGFLMSGTEPKPSVWKPWIWVMVVILVCLLLVPFASMGLAIYRPYVASLHAKEGVSSLSSSGAAQDQPEGVPYKGGEFSALRAVVERMAGKVFNLPQLNPKLHQVQIQAQQPAVIAKASDTVYKVLKSHNQQYVQAVENDRIRIIVILPSKEWAKLSGELQAAAEQDGYLYRGPSQTSSAGGESGSMVAEIEIIRRPGGAPLPKQGFSPKG
jgi:hypothetical protein